LRTLCRPEAEKLKNIAGGKMKADITMYGADWCGDCRRSKRLLEELDVQVNHIDVEADESAAAKVQEINGGAKSIPVIVFSDGTHLTEPSDNDLKAKLTSLGII
jgi:glutaredoxin-like protein